MNWSTEKVNKVLWEIENGSEEHIDKSCFREGKINLRASNLIYDYTKEEIQELYKCSQSAIYFADKYAHAMTDNGIKKINLRDYQRRMVNTFQEEKNTIMLASRQIGKCVTQDTEIDILENDVEKRIPIGELYMNQDNENVFSKVKGFLYKVYNRL